MGNISPTPISNDDVILFPLQPPPTKSPLIYPTIIPVHFTPLHIPTTPIIHNVSYDTPWHPDY